MCMASRHIYELILHRNGAKPYPMRHVIYIGAAAEPKSCAEAKPSCNAELSASADESVFSYGNRISKGIDT